MGWKSKLFSVLIVAFIITALLRTFVFEGFIVLGDSMEPTIHPGDYVFVNKLAYLNREPKRGDVIVVIPRDEKIKIIKRIIGLPGDRLSIDSGKIIIRQNREDEGEELVENYVLSAGSESRGISLIKLDPKEYFAMGDNRSVSIDSRELGPVDSWDIKGEVVGAFNLKNFKYRRF